MWCNMLVGDHVQSAFFKMNFAVVQENGLNVSYNCNNDDYSCVQPGMKSLNAGFFSEPV